MTRVSMSYAVPLILMMTARAFSGVASAQVQFTPEGMILSTEGQLMNESARDYRERARYPEDSWPLKPGQPDPVRSDAIPSHYARPVLDPSATVITTWPAQISFQYPAPVDLFLSLSPGEGATPGSVVAPVQSVKGEIVNQAREVIGMVDYHDDGAAPDERAGDGVYSARFTMPEAQVPDLADSFNVRIEVVMASGAVQQADSHFAYSNPHARLTGRYRDALREGNLVILAEIEVRQKGRFHLAGTIASQTREPIGQAQTAAELEPGRHWLDLRFYGLMFHDRKVAGPYRLASLVLRTVTRMPGEIGVPVLNAHVTRAYRLDEMTTKSFDEPNLLDAARRAEEGAAGAGTKPKP